MDHIAPVVTHLVHETVEQGGGAFPVDTEFTVRSEIVAFFDVLRVFPFSDTNLQNAG